MILKQVFVATVAVVLLGAGMSMAEPKLYPYPSKDNFCPPGMQPVTANGAICCGVPNQTQTYQSVMRHPVTKPRPAVRKTRQVVPVRAFDCPVGLKGCS